MTQQSGNAVTTPNESQADMSVTAAICRRLMAKMHTSKLVLVQAVHGGGVAESGTVDVLPLVQQIDGNGNGTPHGTVYGLPWSRVQGGKNAIICDPAVGDVGYVVAQDRDISKVKAQGAGLSTEEGYVPNTRRKFHISDGIYAGGCLCVTPEQYLIFTSTGVRLVDMSGNSVSMGPLGMTLADVNANQIVMAAGFVNIITPVLQVNGVPVIVP